MNILETNFVKSFMRMAKDGFLQNWHERNGGNMSYRIPSDEVEEIKECLNKDRGWRPIGAQVPLLNGEFFLITGSGKFFRNMELDPLDSIGIIEVDEKGENYRIVWGLENDGTPTSELSAHLINHQTKKVATNGSHRVIYHAHAPNVIALTFVLPLSEKVFTQQLWEMAPECLVVFPEGLGVVEWMVPCGRDIAVATSKKMEKYNLVIWAHHGIFCSGTDFDQTFGLAHTVEKYAGVLVKVMSIAHFKRQTVSPKQFKELADDFGLSLPEEFTS